MKLSNAFEIFTVLMNSVRSLSSNSSRKKDFQSPKVIGKLIKLDLIAALNPLKKQKVNVNVVGSSGILVSILGLFHFLSIVSCTVRRKYRAQHSLDSRPKSKICIPFQYSKTAEIS